MSNVKGASKILEEMDYTLYCVRYVNPWEGYYLVKGTADQLEKCTIVHTATTSLTTCEYVNKDGVKMTLNTLFESLKRFGRQLHHRGRWRHG